MFSMDGETDDELGKRLSEEGYQVFLKGNYEKAFQLFERAHMLGDARGSNNLGSLLENGEGTDVDLARALSLFRYAASEGFPLALLNTGRCLREGRGCEKDIEGALTIFRQAQSAEGNFELGFTLEREKRISEAKKAYKMSDLPRAKSALGYLLLDEDYDSAISLFRQAAAENDPRGLNNFGALLEAQGEVDQAKGYFKRSAELQFPLAYSNLAAYASTDEEKISLLLTASEMGVVSSMFALGKLYFENGDYTDAVVLLELAVSNGCSDANSLLAKCFFQGLGVAKNHTRGSRLLLASGGKGIKVI